MWRAYKAALYTLRTVMNIEYRPNVDNRSLHFIDHMYPKGNMHSVEGLWSNAKSYPRQKSVISQERHAEFLTKF